ncbi:GumC family protein [Lutimonas zeaxanthinifaciens]|uniref:GumC family protein n=1 Tax=Lutimonas zeaxanthinifaciens TaxID=3060215 RepID=UPI00265CC58B|nr:tyrosine-protein kinase [Lutimonas sp. YSD2104]WKK66837.1 polysaccharide biosynthesis tyrosine autokinase [Lutimonas sp. YSD2104]
MSKYKGVENYVNPDFGKKESKENIRILLEKYFYFKNWYIFSLIIMLILSVVFLIMKQKSYEIQSTIYIDDKESGGLTTEISSLEDLGIMNASAKKSIINEISVLKSRNLIQKVIDDLNLNISYFRRDNWIEREVYVEDIPFRVNCLGMDSLVSKIDTSFYVLPKSKDQIWLKDQNKDLLGEVTYGEVFQTKFGDVIIHRNLDIQFDYDEEFRVQLKPKDRVLHQLSNQIMVQQENVKSSILKLKLRSKVKKKGIQILNLLIETYNNQAIDYKRLITENTDTFINDRIIDISNDLRDVDKGVEEFKTRNKLSDISQESSLTLQSNADLEDKIVELGSQIQLVDFLLDHLRNNSDDLIPSNIILVDARADESANIYNQLLLERNRILKNSSRLNPTVINLESQMLTLRRGIEQNLINFRSSLNFSLKDARNQEYRLNTKRGNTPGQEREFQDIKRKQQIVESLYLYLLQKKEENAIKLGLPVPNAKIIDSAFVVEESVSPKPLLTIFAFGFIGMLIPMVLMFIRLSLDNKVHSREDVENFVNAPVLGEIPETKIRNKIVVSDNNNDEIAESFRLIRTNIGFLLPNIESSAKSIFITSTIPSEGKTFITINLAASLALLEKKVIVIGADIRKPKIQEYLDMNHKIGLSNYLINKNFKEEDIIISSDNYKFDFIPSGDIPPNPSEILTNGRFDEIISFCKENYDYVLVDTPPIKLVTDTLLIAQFADLFIYTIRAEVLDKRMLKLIQSIQTNKRLPNLTLLINGLNVKRQRYGYSSYNYYGKRKVTWKERIKINFRTF